MVPGGADNKTTSGGELLGTSELGGTQGELGPLGCGAPRYLRTQRGTRAGTWSEQDHSRGTSLCFPLGPQWGEGLKLRSGGPLRPHPTVLGSSCSLPCSITTCGSPTPSRQGSAPPWLGTALAQSHRAPGASLLSRIPALPTGALGLIAGHQCPTLSLPFTPSAPGTESFYCILNPPQGLCMCSASCLKQPFPGSQSRLKSYLLGETTLPPSWPNQPHFRLHQLASTTSWPSHLFTPGSHLQTIRTGSLSAPAGPSAAGPQQVLKSYLLNE